jgi:NAD(P)-dependent dehydrogenase (short-subunit alcohol dehydrogenase family)
MPVNGLRGRRALIVAGETALGRAVALELAASGADLAIHAQYDLEQAQAVVKDARALGVRAMTVIGDVSDFDASGVIARQAQDWLESVDMLVHCLGIRPHSPVSEMPLSEWRSVMDTNCSSFVFLAQRLLPGMTARGFGRLVAVSAALDDRALPQHASVAAARAALKEVVKVIAVENGKTSVTANIVSIAINEDARTELLNAEQLGKLLAIPRPGTLREIASACAYLCSEEGSYITGQTLHVDGGYTL